MIWAVMSPKVMTFETLVTAKVEGIVGESVVY